MICALSLFIYEYCLLILIATIHFGFRNLGGRGPLWVWAFVVLDGGGVTDFLQVALQSPYVSIMV